MKHRTARLVKAEPMDDTSASSLQQVARLHPSTVEKLNDQPLILVTDKRRRTKNSPVEVQEVHQLLLGYLKAIGMKLSDPRVKRISYTEIRIG